MRIYCISYFPYINTHIYVVFLIYTFPAQQPILLAHLNFHLPNVCCVQRTHGSSKLITCPWSLNVWSYPRVRNFVLHFLISLQYSFSVIFISGNCQCREIYPICLRQSGVSSNLLRLIVWCDQLPVHILVLIYYVLKNIDSYEFWCDFIYWP